MQVKASIIDNALANVSDVPSIGVKDGIPTITFSGNYEAPTTDLVEFLSRLQRNDDDAAEAARGGLHWQDGFYGGYGTATLNGVTLEGVSRYQECAQCEDPVGVDLAEAGSLLCADCASGDEEGTYVIVSEDGTVLATFASEEDRDEALALEDWPDDAQPALIN